MANTPQAKKIPKEITTHSHTRTDNYSWIRDDNWQEFIKGNLNFANPEVKNYIDNENQYTNEIMKETSDLQKEIYETLVSRTKEDDSHPAKKHGNYSYYSRIEKGQDYRLHCRKENSVDASEEIYLNENERAKGLGYYRISALSQSQGDRYLLLAENKTGSMECSITVRDLDKGADLDWTIPNSTGSTCWCGDFEHIYYIERHPENGRGQKVYRVNILKGPESKELIFEKPQELSNLFMGINPSANHDYIFITCEDGNSNQLYYLDGRDPKAKVNLFHERIDDILVEADFAQDKFFILSNENKMVNNQLYTCSSDSIDRGNWKIFIEHSQTHYLKFFDLYQDQLVYMTTNNELALPELYIQNLTTNKTHKVDMKDEAYCIDYIGALEFESKSIQFAYHSPIRPVEYQEIELETANCTVIKKGHCPNFDSSKYVVKRLYADAHDGVKIPITYVAKKDVTTPSPHFQYAYGSYGITMPAFFSSTIFALIDKGFSFSICHIRGGADKGYQWYLDGKLDKKLNTFKDYISCSKYLIDQELTSAGKITANGGSAGGLLMGAIANMAPELYNSIILDVPFVDTVTTILDDTLPLTPPEWNEWGNPIKDKNAYEYMMSYSPYDNVAPIDYPHMLFNSGITDEQVTYWEPTKMVAKLRELKTNDNMLLLKMKMTAGHAGSSARYKALEERAFSYAFALKAQGMN